MESYLEASRHDVGMLDVGMFDAVPSKAYRIEHDSFLSNEHDTRL